MDRCAIACLAALLTAPLLGNAALARHRDFSNMSPFEEEGRPVTGKDIAGKKFCWNNGHWAYFMTDGSFTSDRRQFFKKRPGHWRAPQPGVIEIGYSERQAEILPNGQLHEYWYALAHGKEKGTQSHDKDLWGTVCN